MIKSLHKRATLFGVSALTLAILLSACGANAGGISQGGAASVQTA